MDSPATASQPRLLSLDAFRGAIMALMVLVNNGGGPESYAQLQHSKWNGWTLTDFVFPSFLWMVGVAITLSLGKRLASGVSKGPAISSNWAARGNTDCTRTACLFVSGFSLRHDANSRSLTKNWRLLPGSFQYLSSIRHPRPSVVDSWLAPYLLDSDDLCCGSGLWLGAFRFRRKFCSFGRSPDLRRAQL